MCTRGATAVNYIVVLGLVALIGSVAFAEFGDSVRGAVRAETRSAAMASGDELDGPIGSLAGEVATAGAEALVVQGSWALAAKAGTRGLAASRRKQRGRAALSDSGRARRGAPDEPDTSRCAGSSCNGRSSCFVAGTPVSTPRGPRPIEALRAGDVVLSEAEHSGEISLARITRTFTREAPRLVEVQVMDEQGKQALVRATPEHPFFVIDEGWTAAGQLAPGDLLSDATGLEAQVIEVTPLELRATVYNFEVERTHTYFVGDVPVLVHNPSAYGQVYVVVTTPDGQQVLTIDKNKKSRVWNGNLAPRNRTEVRNRPPDGVPSFPGGGLDAEDTVNGRIDPVTGGLREFKEETGVDLAGYAHQRSVINFNGYSVVHVTMSPQELARLQQEAARNIAQFRARLDEIHTGPGNLKNARVTELVRQTGIHDEEVGQVSVRPLSDVNQRLATNHGNPNHKQSTDWFEDALSTIQDLRTFGRAGVTHNGTTGVATVRNDQTGHYDQYRANDAGEWVLVDRLSDPGTPHRNTYNPISGVVTRDANPGTEDAGCGNH